MRRIDPASEGIQRLDETGQVVEPAIPSNETWVAISVSDMDIIRGSIAIARPVMHMAGPVEGESPRQTQILSDRIRRTFELEAFFASLMRDQEQG